jgi:predicted Zn-dependent protease/Tfp pilus assembly protein PilF
MTSLPPASHPLFKRTTLALLLLASFAVAPVARAADAVNSLDSLITRANTAAEAQDYATAIPLYEKALHLVPAKETATLKTLNRNLAIIDTNYGVSLQEKKQYEQAIQYMDKGLALVAPDSKDAHSIQAAKASVYFSQAMDLKDSTDTHTTADYEKMRALLSQAITLNPTENTFKKAMAGVYMDEAYQLATQEKFAEARPLLEKALEYDPQNKSAKESLANVYLGLARNDADHRKEWLDKAVATDDAPKIQQIVARIQAQGAAPADSSGFGASPTGGQVTAPADLSKLSVADMVRDMENQLQITPPKNASLQERVDTLEKQVMGKTQSGALATRTKAVYTALMGSYNGVISESNPNLVQAPVNPSQNTYLDDIFKVTDGKVIRWGKFPLRVYFDTPKDNPLFKPEYKQAALQGFQVWKDKTNGFINFVEIKNPQSADIQVSWADQYVDRFADAEHVPTLYKDYSPPKRNPLLTVVQMASMFTPGYFSLIPQAASSAMQYQQYKKLEVIQNESKITLGLDPVKNLNPDAAKLLMQNMAAKEFGHALGLKGISPTEGDLLYPALRSDVAQVPTSRDLATLRELYNRPPNIILNIH